MGKYYGLRTCKHPDCDEEFEPYRSWQEFHSPACRNSFYEKFSRHPFEQVLSDKQIHGKEKKGGDKNGKPEKFR